MDRESEIANVRLKTHSERTAWNFHDAMRYTALVYPGKFTSRYYSSISVPYVCRVPRFIIQYEGCLSSPISTFKSDIRMGVCDHLSIVRVHRQTYRLSAKSIL